MVVALLGTTSVNVTFKGHFVAASDHLTLTLTLLFLRW